MNTEGGKTLEDLKKELGEVKILSTTLENDPDVIGDIPNNIFKVDGSIFDEYARKKPALIISDIDDGKQHVYKSVDEKFLEEEKLKAMVDPVKEEKPEMTGELSYLDVEGLAAPNNNLLVRIPDSCYMKGNMRLVSPMITGFLPVALVGPSADLYFTDVNGETRAVEIGDYVMLEEMNYPTVALGEERNWDNKGKKAEPFRNTYLIIGSHQVLVVKGNPNRVEPANDYLATEESSLLEKAYLGLPEIKPVQVSEQDIRLGVDMLLEKTNK